ncbi:MAG: SDR family oxidoreductase [Rubrobacteraceae bacterium]
MNEKTTRNILVTGTNSGLGRATAETLARDGHNVFASMRGVGSKNLGAVRELEALAEKEDLDLEVVELDVTEQESVDAAISRILDAAGHLDVVVNNAGAGSVGVLEGFTMEQVQHIFETNAFGALRVNKAVLPSMRERGSGLLIHVSSTAGRVQVPFVSPYSAAKAALEAMAEELSFELAPFGVESVIVEPGTFATAGFGKLRSPADESVISEYGELATKPREMFAGLTAAFEDPQMVARADPQLVADATRTLIDTPAGERPLRTVVGTITVEGVAELNETYAAIKKKMLVSLGAA